MEARPSATVQIGPGAHLASCTMGIGPFWGVKWPRRGNDHPPPSSAEVKERLQLNVYSHSGPSWTILAWTSAVVNLFIRPVCETTYSHNRVLMKITCNVKRRGRGQFMGTIPAFHLSAEGSHESRCLVRHLNRTHQEYKRKSHPP